MNPVTLANTLLGGSAAVVVVCSVRSAYLQFRMDRTIAAGRAAIKQDEARFWAHPLHR